jgi:serine/threonine-protein kinase
MIEEYECPHCSERILWNEENGEEYISCTACGHRYRTQNAMPLSSGTIVKDYRIIRLIGRGGMGEIYLAEQTSMLREVALKVLNQPFLREKTYLNRFYQEVKMLAKVEHPNIVSAFEAGYENGICFFSMRYVRGDDVDNLIKSKGIFTEIEALETIREVALALDYVWDKHKMVHRDVKPANIMITENNDVKLMDLGISKSMDQNLRADYTVDGVMVGSPFYISPEQAVGAKNLDFRTDIYSLGATFYHMITGHLPFEKETPIETAAAHIREPITDPRRHRKEISKLTVSLVKKMMMKKVEDRFLSWQAVIDEIDNAIVRIRAEKLPTVHKKAPKVSGKKKKKRRYSKKQIVKHRIKRTVIGKAIYKNPKKHIFLFVFLAGILIFLIFLIRITEEKRERADALLAYKAALSYIRGMSSDDESFQKAEEQLLEAKNMGIAEADKTLSILKAKWRKTVIKRRKEQALHDLDKLKEESMKFEGKKEYGKALNIWLEYKKTGRFAEELQIYVDESIEKLKNMIKKRQKKKEKDI